MRIVPLAVLALSLLAAAALPIQEKEDLYSIPAKSGYNLQSLAGKQPLTRAERTNFTETSRYEDVVAFIDSLRLLGAKIEIGSLGKTALGRDLPYVIASRPLITSPAEARRLGRPVAYIQGNIHSGEVEGKEASLALLRDLLFDPKPNVLDSIVLIVQPDYNADGNEHLDIQSRNRGAQNGPELVGTRTTSCGWNLNRDYVSADAPETKAALKMLNRWNPDLFMDLHTTNGSIHGYALTYSPTLTPTAVTTRSYVTDTMLPAIRARMRERHGFEVNDYGDFSRTRASGGGAPGGALGGGGFGAGRGRGAQSQPNAPAMRGCDTATFNATNRISQPAAPGAARGGGGGNVSLEMMIADSIPASGWVFSTYEPYARYGSNYYGLRGRIAILSEAFSHDPFARRVASTYDFVSEALSYIGENRKAVIALGARADAQVAAWGRAPRTSPQLAIRAEMDTTRVEDVRVEMITPLTDSTKREPGMGNRQRTGIIKRVRMPMMVSFRPTLTSTLPFAYAIDAKAWPALKPILDLHGIRAERVSSTAQVTAQSFTIDTVIDRGQSESARRMRTVPGRWGEPGRRSLTAGSYIVRASQPYGLLAFYLLEPENDDGLLSWGFFEGLVSARSPYPVMRVTTPVTLRTSPPR
ncbi:MAG TPA: M14 family zinc carboxypeptidase [Gemmatimonadaceae bacterium]|nr:M14 family zinc carboxypeptidase [Gemmatimonadaceae bacterium]